MSVSARQHNAIVQDVQPAPAPQPTHAPSVAPAHSDDDGIGDRAVMISPRVMDQQAFDELSQTLTSLIEEAREARLALAEVAARQQAQQTETARRAQQLQERLQLSARMLKALQAQEQSLQSGSQTSAAAAQQQIDEFQLRLEARMEELVAAATTRINSAAQEAFVRIEHRQQQSQTLLSEIDQRLEQVLPRAERLCQMVETAEVNIAALAHRSAAAVQNANQTTEALSGLVDRASDRTTALQAQLDRVSEITIVIQQADELCAKWRQSMNQINRGTTPSVTAAAQLATLVPTTIRQTEPKPVDSPINSAVQELRESIARDMHRLSTAVSAIASRVDQIRHNDDGTESAGQSDRPVRAQITSGSALQQPSSPVSDT